MKNWFNDLEKKYKIIIEIALGFVCIIIPCTIDEDPNIFISLIWLSALIFEITFLAWQVQYEKHCKNKTSEDKQIDLKIKNEKKLKEQYGNNNLTISYENKKYKELISNNFDLDLIKSNFQCSLLIMTLNQIKENAFFNPSDLSFNINERINEIEKLSQKMFNESKYNTFISVDLETTGLNSEKDRIIQIALIKVSDGVIVDKFTALVNPQMHISSNASAINGIYDEDVKNSKTIQELFPTIINFIEKLPIVAHNAKFDISFLKNEYIRCFNKSLPYRKIICTMKLWRKLYLKFQNEDVVSAKLNTLVINLLNEKDIAEYQANKHDACCDAIATAKVFMKMYDNTVEE